MSVLVCFWYVSCCVCEWFRSVRFGSRTFFKQRERSIQAVWSQWIRQMICPCPHLPLILATFPTEGRNAGARPVRARARGKAPRQETAFLQEAIEVRVDFLCGLTYSSCWCFAHSCLRRFTRTRFHVYGERCGYCLRRSRMRHRRWCRLLDVPRMGENIWS